MSNINGESLRQVSKEEESGLPTSDPAIRSLKQDFYTCIGRVQGSNQSHYQLRSQIWSTSIQKGPPTL